MDGLQTDIDMCNVQKEKLETVKYRISASNPNSNNFLLYILNTALSHAY